MKIQNLLGELVLKDESFAYKKMKKLISSSFTQEMEQKFKVQLDQEILKVFTFINNKEVELIKNLKLISEESKNENIKTEMYNFTDFVKLNIIAIKRIIQRHDKFTGFSILDDYKEQLKEKSHQFENMKHLISTIINEKSGESTYERLAAKFWVPQETLVNIKLEIMQKLEKAVYVNNEKTLDDSCVSTVYLDNTSFSLYSSFLEQESSAFFIRLRWYGRKAETVSCDLIKTSKTDSRSILSSIKIPKKLVLSFINGNNIWNELKQANSNEAVRSVDSLSSTNDKDVYNEIQEKIKKYRLRPTVRTFFKRTIFESPELENLKIHLDSNIVMVKECSSFDFENDSFPLKSWARTDVTYDWPFRNLTATEIVRFPFSVLEIVTADGFISAPETVKWLEDLLSNSKIEKVPRFSKFVHGCSILYPNSGIAPSWNPLVDGMKHKNDNEIMSRSQFSNDYLHIPEESEVSYNMTPLTDEKYKVVVPVRVEPKVFFANERTFLSWIQFAIFLGGIGTAMIGLGNVHAYLCGVMFIGVAAVFSFYALYLFHYRAMRIRVKDPGPYSGIKGPAILSAIFIIAMVLSFIFKFPMKKGGLK